MSCSKLSTGNNSRELYFALCYIWLGERWAVESLSVSYKLLFCESSVRLPCLSEDKRFELHDRARSQHYPWNWGAPLSLQRTATRIQMQEEEEKKRVTHVNISFCILNLRRGSWWMLGYVKCLSYGRGVHKLSHPFTRKICCLSYPPFVTFLTFLRHGRVSYWCLSVGSRYNFIKGCMLQSLIPPVVPYKTPCDTL